MQRMLNTYFEEEERREKERREKERREKERERVDDRETWAREER